MCKTRLQFFSLTVILLLCVNVANADVSLGNPKGPIVLVEYFDYNCPVCRHYMPTIDVLAHANPDLKVIQRVVPVLARTSQIIDRAVLAAYFQGKFSLMQQAILQVQDRETIPPQKVLILAKGLKLNLHTLFQDMNSNRIKQQLVTNLKAFEATHQTRVPVMVLYNVKQPNHKIQFVGTQRLTTLQQAIRSLQ